MLKLVRWIYDDAIAHDPVRMRNKNRTEPKLTQPHPILLELQTGDTETRELLDGFSSNLVWMFCHRKMLKIEAS
jgi:hypothetical protein